MMIYPGRIYTTKDGNRVKIVKQVTHYHLKGQMLTGVDKGKFFEWTRYGTLSSAVGQFTQSRDIVSPKFFLTLLGG